MEIVIDTLLKDIQDNWDEETLGEFLSNIYALGRLDAESEKEAEDVQTLLLMSPIMSSSVVFDYIYNRIDEYVDELDDEDEDNLF